MAAWARDPCEVFQSSDKLRHVGTVDHFYRFVANLLVFLINLQVLANKSIKSEVQSLSGTCGLHFPLYILGCAVEWSGILAFNKSLNEMRDAI